MKEGKSPRLNISYLTQAQNDFITYLNRKTDKTNIAEININK